MFRRCVAVVMALAALAACGGSDDSDSDTGGGDLAMGASAPVEKGTLTISAPSAVTTDAGIALEVQVALEAGDSDGEVPNIGLMCAGEPSMGTYLASSTIALGDPVPAGTTATGALQLILPTGLTACATPAYVVGEVNGFQDTQVRWLLDDALAAKITAA